MPRLEIPETMTVEITDISRGGKGVARLESGMVVFVPYTAPGDTVKVRLHAQKKNYADGELLEILTPSPKRIAPRCPAFGSCGGCEWQHLPYELQWSIKTKGMLHALTRVQGNPDNLPLEELPADDPWYYRNRVQMRGFQNELGFYARGSKKIVPIEECFIARKEINAALAEAKAEGQKLPKEYKLELEVHESGEVTKTWNSRHSALGFRQVFDAQNAKLQQWIAAVLKDKKILLDLFGGDGNLSRPLASQAESIHCVDTFAPAVNPPAHAPKNLRYYASPAHKWLERLPQDFRATSAILDPPREGLDVDYLPILKGLARIGVEEAVLVGCDLDSWTRDVSRFQRYGWRLQRIAALDLFPQTHHLEALGYFTKSP